MKKLKVLFIALVILITSISANAVTFVQNYDWAPFYYEKVTLSTDAVSRLNQTYREDSKGIFVTVETNSIRFRIDGGDPDANDGHVVIAGGNVYLIDSKSVRNLRMIAVGGTATVIVTYYK